MYKVFVNIASEVHFHNEYRKLRIIDACAYCLRWLRVMRLLHLSKAGKAAMVWNYQGIEKVCIVDVGDKHKNDNFQLSFLKHARINMIIDDN